MTDLPVGQPIPIGPDDTFRMDVRIPKLKLPNVEVLVTELKFKEDGGAERSSFEAALGDDELACGPVRVRVEDPKPVAMGNTREEAVGKLTKLLGEALARTWLKLLTVDPEAAKGMELDP